MTNFELVKKYRSRNSWRIDNYFFFASVGLASLIFLSLLVYTITEIVPEIQSPCIVDFPRLIEGGNIVRESESVNYLLYFRGHRAENDTECQTEIWVTKEEYEQWNVR